MVVCVTDGGKQERLLMLISEAGDNVSLRALAQPCLTLAGRRIALDDAIKIVHDLLQPAPRQDGLQFATEV